MACPYRFALRGQLPFSPSCSHQRRSDAGVAEYNPNAGRIPQTAPGERSVPNVKGCVALCNLDTSLCDPTCYKKLDARYTLKD